MEPKPGLDRSRLLNQINVDSRRIPKQQLSYREMIKSGAKTSASSLRSNDRSIRSRSKVSNQLCSIIVTC